METFQASQNSVKGVADKTDVVSSSVSSVNERVDDIRLVLDLKVKGTQTFGAAFGEMDLEIIRWQMV